MNPDSSVFETAPSGERVDLAGDYLKGAGAVAKFLGWNVRKVRYARETGSLPIRVKTGIGLYAFRSELVAALKTADTLNGENPKARNRA